MKLTPVSTPLGWACMDHYRQGERTAQSQRTPWKTHTLSHTHTNKMLMHTMATRDTPSSGLLSELTPKLNTLFGTV